MASVHPETDFSDIIRLLLSKGLEVKGAQFEYALEEEDRADRESFENYFQGKMAYYEREMDVALRNYLFGEPANAGVTPIEFLIHLSEIPKELLKEREAFFDERNLRKEIDDFISNHSELFA